MRDERGVRIRHSWVQHNRNAGAATTGNSGTTRAPHGPCLLVPVLLGLIERWEHEREDSAYVIRD